MSPARTTFKPREKRLPPAETVLLDYAERLDKFRSERRAVWARLSKLKPYNRRSHHLRVASAAFDPLTTAFEGALFQLRNGDLIVVCKGATVAQIDDYVLRLRFLFSEDPFFATETEDEGSFCVWFDLEQEYPEFLAMAREEAAAQAREAAAPSKSDAKARTEPQPQRKPMDAPRLSAIAHAIAQADLSHLLQRQPICAIAKGADPMPVLYEVYISIHGLRDSLLPNYDLEANQWLFQDLTRHLDQRMISILRHQNDSSLHNALSVNLNIETLLSPEFLALDAVIRGKTKGAIVVELQLIDIFADLANFAFARDFLRDRGYRICLDGVTHLSLPFIDREALGLDLIKLRWSSDLPDYFNDTRRGNLRSRVENIGAERMILCRCDAVEAIELGRSLGITLYQGYYVDDLLAQTTDRDSSTARALTAMAQHRADARLAERVS